MICSRNTGERQYRRSLRTHHGRSSKFWRLASIQQVLLSSFTEARPGTSWQFGSHEALSSAAQQIQCLCQQGNLDLAVHVMSHLPHPTTDLAYMSILHACIKNKSLCHAKQVSTHFDKLGVPPSCNLSNYLVETLAKCGCVDDALGVFNRLPHHTVLSWTALISAYTECGRGREALRLHQAMLEDGVQPNRFTYITLLKACCSICDLTEGRKIHADLRNNGFVSNVFVGSTLISMYGKCGSIKEAEIVFCELPVRNGVTWNALLSAYVDQNEGEKALRLYRQMRQEGVCPYERTYVIALQACAVFAEEEEYLSVGGHSRRAISLEVGRALHVDGLRDGAASDAFMGSALLSMYGKCGSFDEAESVLSQLSQNNIVYWNVLLSAYVQHNQGKKALLLYKKMLEEGTSPDELTFVAVFQACGILSEIDECSQGDGQAHKLSSSEIVKALQEDAFRRGFSSDIFLGSTLINAYGKCESITDAESVFQSLLKCDIATWNSMLSAYVYGGQAEKALRLYKQMQVECLDGEERTFVIALQACCILAEKETISRSQGQENGAVSLLLGQAFHADAKKKGFDSYMFLCNSLVSMYSKCRDIAKAENVFYGMSKRDTISWCTMLTAYVEQGKAEKALWLFIQMHVEGLTVDRSQCVIVFQACSNLAEEEEAMFVEERLIKFFSLRISQAIHAYAEVKNFISDVMVGSTLLCPYGKCGAIREAQSVFNELFQRDIVSWNAMLSAYLEHGYNDDALSLFMQMQKECVTLDNVTFLCILQACSETENEEICRELHFIIAASVWETNLCLTNSLIHAYGSCASMENAREIFDGLCEGDVVSWTACISGYARKGDIAASLQIFEEMHLTFISPDEITFVSLFSACSHAGFVQEGVDYFSSMSKNYGIAPNSKHYAGMIDLLGRAGNFMKMESLLVRMPVKADLTTWLSLLAVCRTHGNNDLGKLAFEHAVCIQPMESTAYILMSNIYAEAGLQESCE